MYRIQCSIIIYVITKKVLFYLYKQLNKMEQEPQVNAHQDQENHVSQVNPSNITTTPHISLSQGYVSYTAEDGNIVWAGAMTLAWKSLCQFAKVNHLEVTAGKDNAEKFNQSIFSIKDLEENSYYIKNGKGVQTIRAINKQRNEKFPQCSFPLLDENVQESTLITYAYLYKKISFPVCFSSYRKPYFEFHGKTKKSQVVSFQAYGQQQFGQILLLEYVQSDDFLVMIAGENPNDEIYLMKSRNDNLDVKGAIQRVMNSSNTNKNCRYLNNIDDRFEVPVLNLDYQYDHPELVGAQLLNFQNREISKIKEGLKLKLDENGARVQNYGEIFTDQCAIVNPNERIIVCNSPFWVLMREKGKHPYLCVKINDL